MISQNDRMIAFENLHKIISEYFMMIYDVDDHEKENLYISNWAIVVDVSDMTTGNLHDYGVEGFPFKQPPHAIKGLLSEGIDVIVGYQEGLDE